MISTADAKGRKQHIINKMFQTHLFFSFPLFQSLFLFLNRKGTKLRNFITVWFVVRLNQGFIYQSIKNIQQLNNVDYSRTFSSSVKMTKIKIENITVKHFK